MVLEKNEKTKYDGLCWELSSLSSVFLVKTGLEKYRQKVLFNSYVGCIAILVVADCSLRWLPQRSTAFVVVLAVSVVGCTFADTPSPVGVVVSVVVGLGAVGMAVWLAGWCHL